ncbi:glycosyltransferase family 4 protein [Gluconacetobacter diazotrophicus]|uniref:glycosyltransferase family 4 protein n=1 Tax=Gluconacetobacter diazotrophicus TaxID=33996 RepID=UPI001199A00D|nr:glycosyltransferase family 4 protein [Gluconacetobacter diazotrophicus]TWB06026.1 glycosyltransferase involved in cell wall biosynthesis [Gluconacetobacter diazotrophicus]
MRYLFVHQHFPGQYLHLLRHLRQDPGNEIVFISEPNDNHLPGVRRVAYRPPRGGAPGVHPAARDFDLAMLRAESVARAAASLRDLGYRPDIVIGHHGWGELLNMGDVFPGVPVLGYFEFFYHADALDVGFDPEFPSPRGSLPVIRARNAINLQALAGGGDGTVQGQTPTRFQWMTYPAWARGGIEILPEGVDLAACSPDPAAFRRTLRIGEIAIAPRDRLVTYVARDLEPYRGFHVFMRALPRILAARPDVRVVLVGGDGVSYGARLPAGSWRARMLAELTGRIDLDRVHFPGKVEYDVFRALLRRSDAHVYLTYPFVASWSLREAMAMGCAIVGSDTAPVREFLSDGRTGRLVPFLDPDGIAAGVLEVLEDRALATRLRRAARRQAERTLDMGEYMARYRDLIDRMVRQGRRGRASLRIAARSA